MTRMNKWQAGGLALAGLATLAFLGYKRTSPQKRNELINDMKTRGRHFYEEWMPLAIKTKLSKPINVPIDKSHFGEGSYYSS